MSAQPLTESQAPLIQVRLLVPRVASVVTATAPSSRVKTRSINQTQAAQETPPTERSRWACPSASASTSAVSTRFSSQP